MKKHLLVTALFCITNLLAQNKVAEKVSEFQRLNADFRSISVLLQTQNILDKDVNKVVDGATLATIKLDKINEVVTNQFGTIELEIPYQNQNITLLLYIVNPFAEGFHVDTDKGKNTSYQKGVYYRGIIKGETNSVAAFNFFNGEFNGIISSSSFGNIVVGKLDKINNQTDYIVYSDAKMKVLNDFNCHVKDIETVSKPYNEVNRNVTSDRCVTLYFEIDNNLFVQNGSDITTTTNWMTSVFNNVQTLYANDAVTVGLKSIFIWTDPDPYDGVGTGSTAYLLAFAQNRPVFDGDLGQLLGVDPGPLGGVAFLNTLCVSNNFSYADLNGISYQTVPTYSWTVLVITHEFGHSLGSRHTHACAWNGNNTSIDGCGTQAGYDEGNCALGPIPLPDEKGTIMSYCHLISGVGISLSNGFGPQPAALILANVNNSSCLSSDCVSSCPNTVREISITGVTPTSVDFTWTEVGAYTSWQVSVTPFLSSTIVWNTVTTATFSVSGLDQNTYYKIRVRPYCTGFEPAVREKIVATAADNFCAGLPFTDTGGTTDDYTDMESWTRTMIPDGSGSKLKVEFSSFSTEDTYDFLYIYDGPNEFATPLTPNGLTGTLSLGTYNSTATDGSLTFKFYSDQGVIAEGWNATITCTETLGEENNNFLDYSYYPNPTTGNVAIISKDAISEVLVYNVQGQVLFTQKTNQLSINIDISSFASGTYFFKLKINDREANFKIVKM